jgi:hypothetical protein
MADKAFPSVNDLGGGKTLTEANLRDFVGGLMAASGAFVVSGLVVPGSSASLSITIPSGVCYVDGYRLEADAEGITLPGSQTSYIYLQYSIDGSGNITGHGLVSNTTGITPARSILLATAVAGSSTITSTTDRRKVGFSVFSGYQPQALTEVTVIASTVGDANIINVIEQGQLTGFFISSNMIGTTGSIISLKIQIDGSTVYTIMLGTVQTSGAFTPHAQVSALTGQPDIATGKIWIPLNIFYRVSCKVDINNSAASSSGTHLVKLQRSRAV